MQILLKLPNTSIEVNSNSYLSVILLESSCYNIYLTFVIDSEVSLSRDYDISVSHPFVRFNCSPERINHFTKIDERCWSGAERRLVLKDQVGGQEHAAEVVRVILINEANLLEADGKLQLLNELNITKYIIADSH